MGNHTRTTTTIVGMAHNLIAYFTLYLVLYPALGTNEDNEYGGPDTPFSLPLCQVHFLGSYITDQGNHREDYHLTTTIQDGRHVCEVQVQDIVCQAGCQFDEGALYTVLTCEEKAHLQIVFTNPRSIRIEVYTFLHLRYCSTSLLDAGVLGKAVRLKRAKFEETSPIPTPAAFLDEGGIEENRTITKDIIPGLEDILSMQYLSRQGEANSIPHYFCTHQWPRMNSIVLTWINVTNSQINCLVKAMPRLTMLNIKHSTIRIIPDFPRDSQDRWHNYKMIIENSNIANLSYPSLKGRLSEISLAGNKIRRLEEDTFREVMGLLNLTLASNFLTGLPEGLFRNSSRLEYLDLSHNHIRNLSQGTFTGIHRLKTLRLNNNHLQVITMHTFYDFHHLKLLDLSYNGIRSIDDDAIHNGKVLTIVNLQHNKLTHFPAWIFTTPSVITVNLSNNMLSFTALCLDLDRIDMRWVMKSHASRNQRFKPRYYRDVLLHQNNFTTLDVKHILGNDYRLKTFIIILNFFRLDLTDNNVTCDCHTFTMAEFLKAERPTLFTSNNGKEPSVLGFYYEKWICSRPLHLRGIAVAKMKNCTADEEGCPPRCNCERVRSDGPITVDCTNRSMTTLPDVVPNGTATLKLDHNAIRIVENTKYLQDIKNLDLSHNHIQELSDAVIQSFDELSTVDLSHNYLYHIPLQFKHLRHVQLSLAGNFFVCDCNERWAVSWLRSYKMKISKIDNIVCAQGIPKLDAIYEANEKDFICESVSKETVVAIAITIGVVMSLMFILLILGYKFRGEIKLCLYFHLKWHPFDRTDDADISDKLYDAFVSYNNADSPWVINTLLPALENAQKPYRLCIHARDFRPGGLVTDNILFGVKYSRRMILVLTRNFLKSEWSMLEFISAHRRVLKDRTNYLIVILFDGIDIDYLDEDLKLYLKTNTYIEHDSRWFWQRLHYAMPEKPLAIIKVDPYPPEGYGTLFPSPESVMIMQHIDRLRVRLHERAWNGEVLML